MASQELRGPGVSAQDKAEDITFAVELKFLIRQRTESVTAEYGDVRPFVPHEPRKLEETMTKSETRLWQDNWEAIAKVVDAVPGVNASSKHQSQAERTEFWKTHWMVYKANSACPMYMTYFNGDPDQPILDKSAPDYETYIWTPVEICSPILSWPQKTEALADLTKILEAINKHFDVVANPSTEAHVHVGRADCEFYSLDTMKKLATLFWLAEPILRAVKDPKSANHDHHYTYSYPLRPYSRISRAVERDVVSEERVDDLFTGSPHDFEAFLVKLMAASVSWDHEGVTFVREHRQALRAIWGAADYKELAHMLRGPEHKLRRLGFNFHALVLDARGESVPRTIEFRFLEGFIDPSVVPAWVRLCGEILGVVVDQDDDGEENMDFYEIVATLLSIPEELPVDAKFSALIRSLGQDRIPRSVSEPLVAVVRTNYPPYARRA